MATDTDRTFNKSNFRSKDQKTRNMRRVFEDGGGSDSTTIRTGPTSTSRYTRDRNESPSSGVRGTHSITNKINKMTIDDKDDEHLDDDRDRDEGRDEDTSSRRLKKDTGARSRAEDNDGDNEESRDGDEEAAPTKKSQKKAGATVPGAGKRRKEKKNLREKRRSTGVVIMPGQPANETDEEAKAVARNTQANMEEAAAAAGTGAGAAAGGDASGFQETINQLTDELAARHKELDTLRTQMDALRSQNLRLKDENSALLRVVGSLSGTGGGR